MNINNFQKTTQVNAIVGGLHFWPIGLAKSKPPLCDSKLKNNINSNIFFTLKLTYTTWKFFDTVFYQFGQVKFACSGSILGLSLFSQMLKLLQKMELVSIVVKNGLKIIISLPLYKSVKLTVSFHFSWVFLSMLFGEGKYGTIVISPLSSQGSFKTKVH